MPRADSAEPTGESEPETARKQRVGLNKLLSIATQAAALRARLTAEFGREPPSVTDLPGIYRPSFPRFKTSSNPQPSNVHGPFAGESFPAQTHQQPAPHRG
jgi:hypothetical protein